MTAVPRHPRQAKEGVGSRPSQTIHHRKNRARKGRPPPSLTFVSLALLAQLDRYIDQLEVQTGLKANRGMIARRALELFLETRSTGQRKRSL